MVVHRVYPKFHWLVFVVYKVCQVCVKMDELVVV